MLKQMLKVWLVKEVLITCDVDNIRGLGEGKVDGKVWTVRSIDNSHVLKGETAVIEKLRV